MLTGKPKMRPIWTAFVTKQIRIPGWASWGNSRVVVLAELEQFIFTNDYSPPRTSKDEFELTFVESPGITLVNLVILVHMLTESDAEDFMNSIKELQDSLQKHEYDEL